MTTDDLTLAEFLLARVADDEVVARNAQADAMAAHRLKGLSRTDFEITQTRLLELTFRVLADCEAKRAIVEVHVSERSVRDELRSRRPADFGDEARSDRRTQEARAFAAAYVLGILATPYADHPDYRAEWAP